MYSISSNGKKYITLHSQKSGLTIVFFWPGIHFGRTYNGMVSLNSQYNNIKVAVYSAIMDVNWDRIR